MKRWLCAPRVCLEIERPSACVTAFSFRSARSRSCSIFGTRRTPKIKVPEIEHPSACVTAFPFRSARSKSRSIYGVPEIELPKIGRPCTCETASPARFTSTPWLVECSAVRGTPKINAPCPKYTNRSFCSAECLANSRAQIRRAVPTLCCIRVTMACHLAMVGPELPKI